MDYRNTDTLKEKSVVVSNSCSAFIRNELFQIPQGQGIAMLDLCVIVTEKFEGVRDKRQGYVRIGNVLKRAGMSDLFERKVDDSGYTYIVRK